MNIYNRYVSGDQEGHYLENGPCAKKGHIKLQPLLGQFDVSLPTMTPIRSTADWLNIFPTAAFFSGFDPIVFGHVVTVVYKNPSTNKICTVSVTKFGCNVYENMALDSSSRFWPACENLTPDHRSSNVRKALAISNLKNFNKLWNNRGIVEFNRPWDETNAGALASAMKLMEGFTPSQLGKRLLSLGLLQELRMSSVLIDILYDNSAGEKVVAQNNVLVSLLGTHMNQLFDPLLEYSPQSMDYIYVPPAQPLPHESLSHSVVINEVVKELLIVQTNYTMGLVNMLQDLIIPLRNSILSEHPTDNASIRTRLNQLFPPTIDEIARINCLLHNSLKIAKKYGYHEIFKVLASLLPYFYKAFARHQANIRRFNQRLHKFLKQNDILANVLINRKSYTPQQIESIICGSVFELPKIKLIVTRLHQVILIEQSRIESSQNNAELDKNYKTILDTINALGLSDEVEETETKKRIFTPSGRLLIDLARGWPEELAYGWATRKVLSVHEVTSSLEREPEILIIFTDHLLLLSVIKPVVGTVPLKLADILMNSLTNKVPLPKLSYNPDLKVKYWCSIDRIIAKSFDGVDGKCLTLTAYGGNSFKLRDQSEPTFSLVYDLLAEKAPMETCHKIMNSITKAQILHKSSAFHLFQYQDTDLSRYYCAHEKQDYESEQLKSSIVILLNTSKKRIDEIFMAYPQVGMVLTMSSLNNYTIHITGFNRHRTYEVKEVVSTDNLVQLLKEIIAKSTNSMLHSSFMTKELILSGSRLLEVFSSCNREQKTQLGIQQEAKQKAKQKPKRETQQDILAKDVSRKTEQQKCNLKDIQVDAFGQYSNYPQGKSVLSDEPKNAVTTCPRESGVKKRRSVVFTVLERLHIKKSFDFGSQENHADTYHPSKESEVSQKAQLEDTTLQGSEFLHSPFRRKYKRGSDIKHEASGAATMIITKRASNTTHLSEKTASSESLLFEDPVSLFTTDFKNPLRAKSSTLTSLHSFPPSVFPNTPLTLGDTGVFNKDGTLTKEVEQELSTKLLKVTQVPSPMEPITPRNRFKNELTEMMILEPEHKASALVKNRASFATPESKFSNPEARSQPRVSMLDPQRNNQYNIVSVSELKYDKDGNSQIRELESPKKRTPLSAATVMHYESVSNTEMVSPVHEKFLHFQKLPDFLLEMDSEPNWELLYDEADHGDLLTTSTTTPQSTKTIAFSDSQLIKGRTGSTDNPTAECPTKMLLESDNLGPKQSLESTSSSTLLYEFGRQLDQDFSPKIAEEDLLFAEQQPARNTLVNQEDPLKSPFGKLMFISGNIASSPEDEVFSRDYNAGDRGSISSETSHIDSRFENGKKIGK